MSAFYPGAGTDLAPPVLFPGIKTWWYMDGQPRSEHGDDPVFYRPDFLGRLDQVMSQCGFQLQREDGEKRRYYSESTDQTIHYETSTLFPGGWDPVKHAADTLVLCGYDIQCAPPGFFASYSSIITNSITVDTIHPIKSVKRIEYPLLTDLEYWMPEHCTKDHYQRYYRVSDKTVNQTGSCWVRRVPASLGP